MDGTLPNLNPARRPSLLTRSRIATTGVGISALSSSIVGWGNVPGRGKKTEVPGMNVIVGVVSAGAGLSRR